VSQRINLEELCNDGIAVGAVAKLPHPGV